MKRTNEDLCVLAQSGVAWAVDELLRRNERLFRKIVSAVLREFNIFGIMGIDADDLHQEALIKAHELIYKFNADKNIKFSTFIFQPIRNRLMTSVFPVCQLMISKEQSKSLIANRCSEISISTMCFWGYA